MNFKRTFYTILLTFIASNALGQLFGPSYSAYVLKAPNKILPNIKSIALVGFDINGPAEPSGMRTEKSSSGNIFTYKESSKTVEVKDKYVVDHGSLIINNIETELLKERRGLNGKAILDVNTNIYSLVERSKMDQIAAEQKQNLSGMFDESKIVDIGKLAGADAIFTANGTYSYSDAVEKRKIKNKEGEVTRVDIYTHRTVKTVLNVKALSVQDGTLLLSKSVTNSIKKTVKGNKKGFTFGTKVNDLAAESFRNSTYVVVNEFSPYYERERFPIKKIKMKEFKDRAKIAQDYLKQGQFNKAFPIYKAIQEADPYNDLASYNLGTVYEVAGQYQKSLELYELAYQFDESNKTYRKAYERATHGIDMVEAFKNLGIAFNEYEFHEVTSSTLAERCTTKGSKKTRVSVYESDNTSSRVIAKVPGGKDFVIKDETDDFFFVTGLLGGKEGFISKKDAKK